MSNEIRLSGNLAGNPESKKVGEQTITELRVYADDWKYDSDKKEYVPNGGEWYDVTVWKPDLARACFETLKKGARIDVLGHLKVNRYTDKEGKEQVSLQVRAEDVTHRLNRVEQITLRPRGEPANA